MKFVEFVEFDYTPFQIEFSFHRLIEAMNRFMDDESKNEIKKVYFRDLLQRINDSTVMLNAIIDEEILVEFGPIIQELLEILFPIALSDNEIKAVSMPFQKLMFNHSSRFKKIIVESGGNYTMEIRNFNQHEYYIASCCIIMNYYFKTDFDLSRPLFIDLPDAKGILHHYRVLYNADFVEVIPTADAIMLTKEDIDLLEDNYDDLALWQSKFPQKSWILKGFGIISLINVTTESALSLLKENLLRSELQRRPMGDILAQIFSSIFRVPNIRIGYTPFDLEGGFQQETRKVMEFKDYLIQGDDSSIILSKSAYKTLIKNKEYYSISDISDVPADESEAAMYALLNENGVQSCLFAPVVIADNVEGILEIVTDKPRLLHSINAQKLNSIMPIVSETFQRVKMDLFNQVEAIIQREFTTIHPSVYWKFLEEAFKNYLVNGVSRDYAINPIGFSDVYALYGEIDIKGSGQIRNKAICNDLSEQLEKLLALFSEVIPTNNTLIIEKHSLKLTAYLRQLDTSLVSGLEQRIQQYIKKEIHPYLEKEGHLFNASKIEEYKREIDPQLGIYYKYRSIFDKQVGRMNKGFSDLLDKRQKVVQAVYPHYYERFKTDGVEHNIYIGSSICPTKLFDTTYLQNLRLWQLQVMSELMCIHYQNNAQDELAMDVTELLFVYDTPLGIQFRMDEKRFDIDGVYNTRYEIIKKRLDKACIKGTDERIVQPKKITIAFASSYDINDYMSYIDYAQQLGLLLNDVEQFDIQELQSVSGLVGIRVSVNLKYNIADLDYDSLMHNFLKFQYL